MYHSQNLKPKFKEAVHKTVFKIMLIKNLITILSKLLIKNYEKIVVLLYIIYNKIILVLHILLKSIDFQNKLYYTY